MRHAEPCRTWLSVRLPQDHLLQRLGSTGLLCILKYEIFIWPAATKLHIAFRIENALIYLFTTLGSTLVTLLSHDFYVSLPHHL